MQDWGFEGPTFGPFELISITYGTIHLTRWDEQGKPVEYEIQSINNMYFYDGAFYGDLELCEDGATETPVEAKLVVPRKYQSVRDERPAIFLPREHFRQFAQTAAVFVDVVRETLGDRVGDSLSRALQTVVALRSRRPHVVIEFKNDDGSVNALLLEGFVAEEDVRARLDEGKYFDLFFADVGKRGELLAVRRATETDQLTMRRVGHVDGFLRSLPLGTS